MTIKSLSPAYSLGCGYVFLLVVIFTLYGFGVYDDNEYFSWGVPIVFFTHTITSPVMFYMLLLMLFVHQLITNWIYEVVYPWIINTIQNTRETEIRYGKLECITMVNMNSLYGQVHLAFVISGITSQISFLIVLIVADILTLSYINWQYLKNKTVIQSPLATHTTTVTETIELPTLN